MEAPPGVQVNVYGAEPPEGFDEIIPLQLPEHVGLVTTRLVEGVTTVKVAVFEMTFLHPISTTHLILSWLTVGLAVTFKMLIL